MPKTTTKKTSTRGRKPSFENALNTVLDGLEENPEALEKLQAMLGFNPGQTRTVAEGGRTVIMDEHDLEPIPAPEPVEAKPAVIFKSPHAEFKQLIMRGKTLHLPNGDQRMESPVFVEFFNGTARVEDTDIIEAMREIKRRNDAKGKQTPWIEVRDEIAEALKDSGTDVVAISNPEVTTDTPAVALIQ